MVARRKVSFLEQALITVAADDSNCVSWPGVVGGRGYGLFHTWIPGEGRQITRAAHRVVYELLVGPIPDGLQLDHLCHQRACINPRHLEPVTPLVNSQRKLGATEHVCSGGHLRTPENTYINPSTGRRACRECHCIYEQARRARLRTERAA